jgi:phosphoribosyl 1,2-cyclic phosphate 1,2-diphosphodiesterase
VRPRVLDGRGQPGRDERLIGDLHVHSRASDGSLAIRDLFEEARRAGLGFLAITDHDTVAGVAQVLAAGEEAGIATASGIEISAYDARRGRKAHLLGYAFAPPAPAIRAFCGPVLASRDAMTREQVRILSSLGYPVSIGEVEEEARGSTALYKQHVMAVLTRKGAADGIEGKSYRALFKDGGPCDKEIDYPDVFAAMEAIHADGGLAVLAHPGQLDSWDLLEELAEAGLDGVELAHADHGEAARSRVLAARARHPRLILTGGSDFHGAYGSAARIGCVLAPEGAFDAMATRR